VSRFETGIKRVAVLDDGVRVPFDRVLVATGRRATVDSLGLLDGRIRQDAAGWVISDASLRTSNRAVWAAGDVTWLPKHTHTAGVSGAIATRNALLGTSKRMASSDQPRVIFTAPEVASVGARARQRHRSGDRVVTIQHRSLDRAVTEGDTSGFTQLVVDRHGRIKGGTIVGPRAGESLGELALAVARRVDVGALASVTHAYPTFNDGLWDAAIAESQRRIRRGLSGRILRVIRRLRSGRTNDGTDDGDLR
jgi:pyruvate/2-oxoglutarate dehydrogenase complex dihydrolipoamide dehydrogenase (E3) component